MHDLTKIIKDDMVPALGVTEPGDIAFTVAKAKSFTTGEFQRLDLYLSSGIYKNAFTCGIPHTTKVGNVFAAALGVVAADPEKGLLSLDNVKEEDIYEAQKHIDDGKIFVHLDRITSDIFLKAAIKTSCHVCEVTVEKKHANITHITLDGKEIFKKENLPLSNTPEVKSSIHNFTFTDIYQFITTIDISELSFLKEASTVHLALLEEGLASSRTTITSHLRKKNGGSILSDHVVNSAQLCTSGALEARVLGLNKPAMSITGSGAHGIICTMPLYAYAQVKKQSEESLLRATALSYLITIYLKEYSGVLSAFCGCAIAAGSGMACALCFLMGGSKDQIGFVINNMASSITGMICDGGNAGCTMKGITAVDIAFRSAELAMDHTYIDSIHGIIGNTPEETMKNMGFIASPGMVETERTIIDIFQNKLKKS